MHEYALMACPTLYRGQTVRVGLSADQPSKVKFFLQVYDEKDQPATVEGFKVGAGKVCEWGWKIVDAHEQPIAEVGSDCTLVVEKIEE